MARELKPVYLLTGSDRPKIWRALQRLRARVGEEAVELLSASEASGEDAVSACNSLGLFADGGRLVVVADAHRWKAPDVTAISSYVRDPSPGTVLALVGDDVKRDSALAKAVAAEGELLVYDVTRRQLPGWVASEFARRGANADPGASRALIELVGDDLQALACEVDKLATWAAGEPIRAHDVNRLVSPGAETPGFALTDAWGRRDVAATLEACEALLEHATGSRRDELPRVAGMTASHVARVRQCQLYAAEGVSPRTAAARIRRSPFYVEKLFAQAENFTTDELRDAVTRLADLDLALKGGSRLPGDLELQKTLVAITATRDAGAPGTAQLASY